MGISFPSNLTKMKFSSALTICAVLFLGLALSEAKKGGKGGKGKKGFWGKVDDDCKEDLGDAKDSLSCADGSWPMMFKGTACSDVSVGDEITKPEKPTTKPCSEAANGDTEDMGSSCLLCARAARVAREARAARARERWLSLLSTEQPTSLSLQLARIAKSSPLLAKNYSTFRFKADQLKTMNWTQINSVELNFGNKCELL